MNADPEQLELSLDERVATAKAMAYGEQGYMTPEGEFDTVAIVDTITTMVSKAVVGKTAERADVGITRREIMQRVFPKVAGPEGWANTDDPDLAEGVYKALDADCWRQLGIAPDAPVQARLNGDLGLVLVRTKVNPHRTDAVYVTRNLSCLLEDALKPQSAAEKKRADRDAAFTAMLIARVPEHGKRFNRVFLGGLKAASDSAKAITSGALTALDEADDDGDGE